MVTEMATRRPRGRPSDPVREGREEAIATLADVRDRADVLLEQVHGMRARELRRLLGNVALVIEAMQAIAAGLAALQEGNARGGRLAREIRAKHVAALNALVAWAPDQEPDSETA